MGVGRFREVDEDELHTVDACGYAHRVFGGVPQPGFWHAASVRDLQARFALRPEDVAICTYPKCGTTSRGDAWRAPQGLCEFCGVHCLPEVAESAESACSYYAVSAGSGSGNPRLYHFWLYHFWLSEFGRIRVLQSVLDTCKC